MIRRLREVSAYGWPVATGLAAWAYCLRLRQLLCWLRDARPESELDPVG